MLNFCAAIEMSENCSNDEIMAVNSLVHIAEINNAIVCVKPGSFEFHCGAVENAKMLLKNERQGIEAKLNYSLVLEEFICRYCCESVSPRAFAQILYTSKARARQVRLRRDSLFACVQDCTKPGDTVIIPPKAPMISRSESLSKRLAYRGGAICSNGDSVRAR
jgi:hypothetical protein